MRRAAAMIAAVFLAAASAKAQTIRRYYTLQSIPTPPGVAAQIGGIDFLPEGRAFVCFHEGQVYQYDPGRSSWSLFAQGLHEPLGVVALDERRVVVGQRPELTLLADTNRDGLADRYETITDAYGMSGNYHEFNFGPVRDKAGNLFFASSCASSGASPRHELRGVYNPDGRDLQQDYSPVPYRGWIWKVTPDGRAMPFAHGFRQPNGLGFDLEGNLFATDNQGSFNGANKLLHVQQGRFHGMIMSRVWDPAWPGGNPLNWPIERHDLDRVREAVMFPYGLMANSPTQPIVDATGGRFGPFAGQLLIGEMNRPRILRVALEKVAGEWQGMCVPFFDGDGLGLGVVRLAMAPDHSLWVGHTMRQGWAGATGLERIVWTGRTPPEVLAMKLTPRGFDLRFTLPVDPATAAAPAAYSVQRYYYRYHRRYDPRQFEVRPVAVRSVRLSDDRLTASLELEALVPGRIHELKLQGVKSADGAPIVNPVMAYTLNRLLDGTMGRQPPTIQPERWPAVIDAAAFQELTGVTFQGRMVRVPRQGAQLGCWVHAPTAGRHRLTFRYSAPADCTLGFGVNGRGANSPRVFKAAVDGSLAVEANLDQGDNGVFLQSLNTGELTLHSLTIAPL
jgi:hypothetical protein